MAELKPVLHSPAFAQSRHLHSLITGRIQHDMLHRRDTSVDGHGNIMSAAIRLKTQRFLSGHRGTAHVMALADDLLSPLHQQSYPANQQIPISYLSVHVNGWDRQPNISPDICCSTKQNCSLEGELLINKII